MQGGRRRDRNQEFGRQKCPARAMAIGAHGRSCTSFVELRSGAPRVSHMLHVSLSFKIGSQASLSPQGCCRCCGGHPRMGRRRGIAWSLRLSYMKEAWEAGHRPLPSHRSQLAHPAQDAGGHRSHPLMCRQLSAVIPGATTRPSGNFIRKRVTTMVNLRVSEPA